MFRTVMGNTDDGKVEQELSRASGFRDARVCRWGWPALSGPSQQSPAPGLGWLLGSGFPTGLALLLSLTPQWVLLVNTEHTAQAQ